MMNRQVWGNNQAIKAIIHIFSSKKLSSRITIPSSERAWTAQRCRPTLIDRQGQLTIREMPKTCLTNTACTMEGLSPSILFQISKKITNFSSNYSNKTNMLWIRLSYMKATRQILRVLATINWSKASMKGSSTKLRNKISTKLAKALIRTPLSMLHRLSWIL